jgi:hypothetical protein
VKGLRVRWTHKEEGARVLEGQVVEVSRNGTPAIWSFLILTDAGKFEHAQESDLEVVSLGALREGQLKPADTEKIRVLVDRVAELRSVITQITDGLMITGPHQGIDDADAPLAVFTRFEALTTEIDALRARVEALSSDVSPVVSPLALDQDTAPPVEKKVRAKKPPATKTIADLINSGSGPHVEPDPEA